MRLFYFVVIAILEFSRINALQHIQNISANISSSLSKFSFQTIINSFRKEICFSSQEPMIKDSMKFILPLIAGALAGAVGVGIAYPFDTLKTKSQFNAVSKKSSIEIGLFASARQIFDTEGLRGFYGGVVCTMLGQSVIKAVAFFINNLVLNNLSPISPRIFDLIVAATVSGFVTSFFVNPIERVKILMQSDSKHEYFSEFHCVSKIMSEDGILGLLFRGLDATIMREVPGYGIYFVVYSVLQRSALGLALGSYSSLLCGALAGCASWLPVYPFDVIKTSMQNTVGSVTAGADGSELIVVDSNIPMLDAAMKLQKIGGWRIFYKGISPKLLRAAIKHAATFYAYDLILSKFKL